jgi:hypothetical protein
MAREEIRIPDYMGRLAGVRSWKIAPTLWAQMGGWLWSAAMLGPWEDGEETVAVCETGHPTPAKGCSCGLYAFYDTASGMPYSKSAKSEAGAISGVIGATDRIIPGDLAYRAQRARVLALFEDSHDSPKAEIAEAYGSIPIIRVTDFEDFCDWYGLHVGMPHPRG